MDPIIVRYGESVTLPVDAGDINAISADIYIGKPGEAYRLTKNIILTSGIGSFELSQADTRLPLDTYYYQINITDTDGHIEKYPTPEKRCVEYGCDFPEFIVKEALDEIEVIS